MVQACRNRFMICNFGVYDSADDLSTGHANALYFDTQNQTIVRFDPSGTTACCHEVFRKALSPLFPNWRVEQHDTVHGKALQRRDTDSYRGMCVTFSLLFVLVAMRNPTRLPTEVHKYLSGQPAATIRTWTLRLNRSIADVLRTQKRGVLVRDRSPGAFPRVRLTMSRRRSRASSLSSSRRRSRRRPRASPRRRSR